MVKVDVIFKGKVGMKVAFQCSLLSSAHCFTVQDLNKWCALLFSTPSATQCDVKCTIKSKIKFTSKTPTRLNYSLLK